MSMHNFMPVIFCGLAIPLSMICWLGHLAFTKFSSHPEYDEGHIPPTRFAFSILVPFLLMFYGLKRKGVDKSGAVFGLILGIVLSIANHAFLATLTTFFISSSRATKFGQAKKRKIEEDFKGGEGRRNWVQVLCNGGMAFQLAILYLIDCGSGERAIDFAKNYRSSWLGIAILSAFACCNGDTWASEFGTVLSKSEPILITTRKRVPTGTNGGITVIGLLVSFFGGILIGIAYYVSNYYTVDTNAFNASPAQWPLIIVGGIAGLVGSIIDSILGATLQYSGQDEKGRIVEKPGPKVKHISGIRILDNHSVNLISSILTAVIIPMFATHFWPH